MDRQDLKEKLIILSVTTGIFLPLRIIFTAYVSDYWLGSIGIVSAIGLLFVYLIKKNKLGGFGKIFVKQMKKTIGGKTGKYVIGFSILFLIYFGSSLYLIDRGDSVYLQDKEIFYSIIISEQEFKVENIPIEKLKGPEPFFGLDNLLWLSSFEYGLSIAYAVMNDATDGWLSHLIVVIFVEQLEVLGLLYFYRRTFRLVPV